MIATRFAAVLALTGACSFAVSVPRPASNAKSPPSCDSVNNAVIADGILGGLLVVLGGGTLIVITREPLDYDDDAAVERTAASVAALAAGVIYVVSAAVGIRAKGQCREVVKRWERDRAAKAKARRVPVPKEAPKDVSEEELPEEDAPDHDAPDQDR